jgi:hypothetical protein
VARTGGRRQAAGGYNVEVVGFRCEMVDDRCIDLAAIFAARDIRPGEEIRMNYHYSEELVAQVMDTEQIVAAVSQEDLVSSILRLTIHDPDLAPANQ